MFSLEKIIYEESYSRGEGIIIHKSRLGEIILENTILKRKIKIMTRNHTLVNMSFEDIDFEKVDKLENPLNAHILQAQYGFSIETFFNGVALVCWTLYPDGRYFADVDGYGAENCNETIIYAYIDTLGRVIIPFQNMDVEEQKKYRIEAELIAKNRNIQNN